jgi:aspartyl-tRNA(Asn)/glutamyl-tRNA(Gln) amidotransferase subunit A
MTEIPSTIAEAGAWLRAGRITASALTETLLARSHASQDTLGAFVTITDESARAAAARADADFAAGIDRGPLQGIPFAVKDMIATQDAPTTANSRVLDPAWGRRDDATAVRRLRAAGAILTGKNSLHELAVGWLDSLTGFRRARNPWDLDRAPGGSSSGTAAAVAGGLILGGLGTDTGGSIRGPAAYCGISGLKPTFGRVSKEGCLPLAYSLDHVGPMARTARDCALLLQALAGYDPLDASSANVPVPDMLGPMDGSLTGVRVGIPRAYGFTVPGLAPEVRSAVEAAIDLMASAGATVVEVELPHVEQARHAGRISSACEAYAYYLPDLRSKPALFGTSARRSLLLGSLFTGADYVQAQRFRSLFDAECRSVLGPRADVLVMPTVPNVAPLMADYAPGGPAGAPSFMAPWNVTGLPAMSIPCGFSAAGLPIGMQIVGAAFAEPTVLKIADAYQRLTDWHLRVPEIVRVPEIAKEARSA